MKNLAEKVVAITDHVNQGFTQREEALSLVELSVNEFLNGRRLSPEESHILNDMKRLYNAYRSENYSKLWAMGKTLMQFEQKEIGTNILDKFYWGCK